MALGTYQDDILDPSMGGMRQYTQLANGNGTVSFRDDTVYTQVGSNFGAADINAIIDAMYPIGSIYLSVNNVSPSGFFGGTWVQITDTFLMCAGSTYTAGSTGGAATDNITTGGTVGGHALTSSEMPSHRHYTVRWNQANNNTDVKTTDSVAGFASSSYSDLPYSLRGNSNDANRGQTSATGSGNSHTHGFTGASVTVKTLPPYLAVYAWKRTA